VSGLFVINSGKALRDDFGAILGAFPLVREPATTRSCLSLSTRNRLAEVLVGHGVSEE